MGMPIRFSTNTPTDELESVTALEFVALHEADSEIGRIVIP